MTSERLSCGIVPVRFDGERRLALMLRAFQYWDFPKGLNESAESPLETSIREVREETGITALSFDWGERYFDTPPYSRGKVARYYLARTTESEVVLGPSPDTGVPEHHEYRWVDFDEAFDISVPRVREVVVWARQIIGC